MPHREPVTPGLRELAPNLWIADANQRAFGIEMGTRMTVVRFDERRLLLHSPVPISPERLHAVRELGRVDVLVAPNRFHHLYVGEWQREFPEAALYLARDLERKRRDLHSAGSLAMLGEPPWGDQLEHVELEGLPTLNEVAFFHPSSQTLVISDLAFHIGPRAPLLTRWFFRLSGSYECLAPTRLEKWLVRDPSALRSSLERILEWPFERVVMAHGEVLESGGRAALRAGYAWLLGSR